MHGDAIFAVFHCNQTTHRFHHSPLTHLKKTQVQTTLMHAHHSPRPRTSNLHHLVFFIHRFSLFFFALVDCCFSCRFAGHGMFIQAVSLKRTTAQSLLNTQGAQHAQATSHSDQLRLCTCAMGGLVETTRRYHYHGSDGGG